MTNATTEVRVNTWDEVEQKIAELEEPVRSAWDEVWFRGQADARWQLTTTLERRNGVCSVEKYLRLINRIKPAIETFTRASFEMPSYGEIKKHAHEFDTFHQFLSGLTTYMAHLRHNGFPSPLLDWTSSPYVAAYFAFSRVTSGSHVAIYVFRERPKQMKVGGNNTPTIMSIGPIIKTHKRHFRQQSRYTVCATFNQDNERMFAPHESVFGVSNREQDFLWKIAVPASERTRVLRRFDRFNLNEFTLFDTEEGLLEMLAMREFDLR